MVAQKKRLKSVSDSLPHARCACIWCYMVSSSMGESYIHKMSLFEQPLLFSTETVGKVGTWYWYFGKHNTYHTTSVQVFSNVRPTIPTIPTIPRYFEISIPYHTGSIRYFQMSYPRYPRVPWYGIPRVYTWGMPGTVPYPRFLCMIRLKIT